MIKRTPLSGLFESLGARMTERPGFLVPDFFTSSKEEHEAVRQSAGLFEIFGQFILRVSGKDAMALMSSLVVADLHALAPGRISYCGIVDERGGMVDDVTVYKVTESDLWVVPAPSRAKAVETYLQNNAGELEVAVTLLGYRFTCLSLQGPESRNVLERLTQADVTKSSLPYFGFMRAEVAGVSDIVISRTGFTGELGFELFVPTEFVEHVYRQLLECGAVSCGLSAMASLRIEKRYLIYGRDIDAGMTPVEAGLGWTVKNPRDYAGKQVIESQIASGPERLIALVALDADAPLPIPGAEVWRGEKIIGRVTTAAFGHTVGKMLALALLDLDATRDGTEVVVGGFGGVVHAKAIYDPANARLRA